jgi:penicillin-binding protein 1C
MALTALREQMKELKNKNVRDGAVVVLDSKTGKSLAYIGNAGSPWTEFYQIDGLQAQRQLGSTIKPFIYATAFDLNILELNSLVEDSKADIPIEGGGVYHPQNYDHSFRGLVSASEALASSLNVPAVRTLLLVGQNHIIKKLKQVGFSNLKDDDFYGPSLALGTVDASLWQLTHAYRNLGQSEVFSLKTRRTLFSALSIPEYRRFTFGLESTLNLPFSAAVKTGTSKDMRDNWCIGWTDRFTVGVWVGNFNGQPMWNVSGMTGAAPIWRKIMLALHIDSSGNTPNYQINNDSKFIKASTPLVTKTLTHIRYPVPNMILAYDQDIPKHMQKISFEIENPIKGQKLFLNGKLLTNARESYLWTLERGHFTLSLKASTETKDQHQNQQPQILTPNAKINSASSIDEIHFEVR